MTDARSPRTKAGRALLADVETYRVFSTSGRAKGVNLLDPWEAIRRRLEGPEGIPAIEAEAAPAGGLREARPEPMCGPEPPFDPEGCGHDHHGWLVCGELVGSSGGPMPEPVYCEHVDRRYALWLERASRASRAALAASPSAAPLDVAGIVRFAVSFATHPSIGNVPDCESCDALADRALAAYRAQGEKP